LDGDLEGWADGRANGCLVGCDDGWRVGCVDGWRVGSWLGCAVGCRARRKREGEGKSAGRVRCGCCTKRISKTRKLLHQIVNHNGCSCSGCCAQWLRAGRFTNQKIPREKNQKNAGAPAATRTHL
jgi:hypothetical protein